MSGGRLEPQGSVDFEQAGKQLAVLLGQFERVFHQLPASRKQSARLACQSGAKFAGALDQVGGAGPRGTGMDRPERRRGSLDHGAHQFAGCFA